MTAYLLAVTFAMALIGTQLCGSKANINLDSFAVGDCVVVYYTAPTVRATISLVSEKGASSASLCLSCEVFIPAKHCAPQHQTSRKTLEPKDKRASEWSQEYTWYNFGVCALPHSIQ